MRVWRKKDGIEIECERIEDLVALKRVLEPGSVVEGSSFRRFKPFEGESGERKEVRVQIRVEEVEFAQAANKVRLGGEILWGTPEEFVQLRAHHTLDAEIGSRIKMLGFPTAFQEMILKNAVEGAREANCLVCLMENKEAQFYSLAGGKTKPLFELNSGASKANAREYGEQKKAFFFQILKELQGTKAECYVVAGPGFAWEDFKKFASDNAREFSKTIFFDHCSTIEQGGVRELVKRGLLERVSKKSRLRREFLALDEFKESVANADGLSTYRPKFVKVALDGNAVAKLLVSDEFLRTQEGEELWRKAEENGIDMIVFDSSDEAGEEFSEYKAAAMLKYKFFE